MNRFVSDSCHRGSTLFILSPSCPGCVGPVEVSSYDSGAASDNIMNGSLSRLLLVEKQLPCCPSRYNICWCTVYSLTNPILAHQRVTSLKFLGASSLSTRSLNNTAGSQESVHTWHEFFQRYWTPNWRICISKKKKWNRKPASILR